MANLLKDEKLNGNYKFVNNGEFVENRKFVRNWKFVNRPLTIHFQDEAALHSFPHFHFLSTNPNQFQFCSSTESSSQSSLPAQTHLAGLARHLMFRKAQVPCRQLELQQFSRLNKLSDFQTKNGRQFGNARIVPSKDTGMSARRGSRMECLREVRRSKCRCWQCRHKAFKGLKINSNENGNFTEERIYT